MKAIPPLSKIAILMPFGELKRFKVIGIQGDILTLEPLSATWGELRNNSRIVKISKSEYNDKIIIL